MSSWLSRHPGTSLLLIFGAGCFAVLEVAKLIFADVGKSLAYAVSPNQPVPAGSHVLFNNGDTATTTTPTDVGTLQANGATQFTTPDGFTYQVPAGQVPGAFA